MSTEDMMKDLYEHVEHSKKYRDLPLDQIPNFYLKRPLNQQEMELLRLVALCETDNKKYRNNWIRSMVLIGHIPNLLREAKEAEKRGYWQRTGTIVHESGSIELTLGEQIPFPPHVKEH
ncbi:MAG: hypothetical protein J6S80_00330 [Alphaproteobacteria bacterium]|nr:hypothetical protein [Alphaproteobacteria bacterium]